MQELRVYNKPAVGLEHLDDTLVRSLDMLTRKVAHDRGVLACIVHRVRGKTFLGDNAVLLGNTVIVLTVGRRLVNNTHTAVRCDVCVVQHFEAKILELVVQVIKQRFVLPSKQILTLELLDDLEFRLLRVLVECS